MKGSVLSTLSTFVWASIIRISVSAEQLITQSDDSFKDCFPRDFTQTDNGFEGFGKFADYYQRVCCHPFSVAFGGLSGCFSPEMPMHHCCSLDHALRRNKFKERLYSSTVDSVTEKNADVKKVAKILQVFFSKYLHEKVQLANGLPKSKIHQHRKLERYIIHRQNRWNSWREINKRVLARGVLRAMVPVGKETKITVLHSI